MRLAGIEPAKSWTTDYSTLVSALRLPPYFYLFQLFEHSKYMIIYQIGNFWNFESFSNCQILKICEFSKFNNFRSLINLWIDKNENSTILGIVKFGKFSKLENKKFLEFFKFGKPKLGSKNWQIWNSFVHLIFRTTCSSHVCPLI